MNPERGLAAWLPWRDYFAPILEARRAEPKRRPDQRARCGRDRRGEARRRGDLLVPSAAAAPGGRGDDFYRSLGSLLWGCWADPGRNLDGDPRGSLAVAAGHRGRARRWPPLLTITRVTTRDNEPRRGADPRFVRTVMLMLGSANRQEVISYPDPDTFNISPRGQGPNLGWGHGVHVCLGMHLARLEMRTAINLLLDRLPNLRLDPHSRRRRPAHPRHGVPVADLAAAPCSTRGRSPISPGHGRWQRCPVMS